MNIQHILKQGWGLVKQNTPLVFTVGAIAGVASTVALAIKAAPKAEARAEKDLYGDTKPEIVKNYAKITWDLWTPVLVSGGLTVASIVLAHRAHTKRYEALAGLYGVATLAFQEYRESVEENTDKKTQEKVREGASNKMAAREKDNLNDWDRYSVEVRNLQPVLDMFTGQSFAASTEIIHRAQNEFNKRLLDDGYQALYNFYDLLREEGAVGVETPGLGETMGYSADSLMDINVNAIVSDNRPVLTIDFYTTPPKTNFYNNH